jgi:rhodanese-related sulfurtransferase
LKNILPLWWRLPFGPVREIGPITLHQWLEEKRAVQIIDARTGLEYRQGTIGAARFAPLTDTPAAIERLGLDKEQPVVVLCRTGHRSRPGTRWLRVKGYEAYSLQGGTTNWQHAGYTLQLPATEDRIEK